MEAENIPNRNSLYEEYIMYLPARTLAVRELEIRVEKELSVLSSLPRVRGRIKSFDSYFKKYIRHFSTREGTPSIKDLLGIRIICYFLEDISTVEDIIRSAFPVIEVDRKGGDHTFREFGYESIHLLLSPPDYIIKEFGISGDETIEIQIRTVLQDAWAEVEHELIYKAEFTPFDDPLRRKLAAINASLSLADIVFQEIRSYQQELNGELGKRRSSFFKKIEESTDAILLSNNIPEPLAETDSIIPEEAKPVPDPSFLSYSNISIDDLLLEALSFHNNNKLTEAISVYTHILEIDTSDRIRSLIFQHRGMAYFARSHYREAIEDFSKSQKLDPGSYKAAYYEGIVCSVLTDYSKAIESFNRSLLINPYQPYCLFRRGQAYFHLGDFPRALGDCESAISLEPMNAVIKFKELVLDKLKM